MSMFKKGDLVRVLPYTQDDPEAVEYTGQLCRITRLRTSPAGRPLAAVYDIKTAKFHSFRQEDLILVENEPKEIA